VGRFEVILLDTHVLAWTVADPRRLSRLALREIERARRRDGLAISAITLWELASLFTRGRIRGRGSIESSVRTFCEGVEIRPITLEIAAMAAQFPTEYPGDPVDRIIGATACVEDMPLVTRDERVRCSPLLRTVW
jgi:PIN domain nuclease of toxin-antitoxin system